jgi:hypothetical protein
MFTFEQRHILLFAVIGIVLIATFIVLYDTP